MSQRLVIALAQIDCLVGDIDGNARRVAAAAAEARDRLGAGLVVFPELTLTGYPPEDLLLRPGLHWRVEEALGRLAAQMRGIDCIVGYPRRRGGRIHNAAGLLRDGRIVAEYHKQHLPNYSVFDEKRYFAPGSAPCVVETGGVPVGITICEDLWHPGPAAQAAAAGARLLVNLNASPFHAGKDAERRAVLGERCREAGLPVIYVNLVGGQDELVFDGASLAVDGDGALVARLPAFEERIEAVTWEAGRLHPGPVAPELAEEEAVYRALVLGVRDYVEKNRFPGVLVGLSGGIDSALTLAVAADALGPERCTAVLMPSRYTRPMSLEDAEAEARALGVEHHVIPIEGPFAAFLEALAPHLAGRPPDTTEENIQARCRGVILMALSNRTGRLVLTTGNKSEMAVGYATLYGDMAGGFAPIKDVPKTLVYRLARHRNRRGAVIPERVLARPPSAELAPDQEDTDTLPPYEVLDPILERYVEQDRAVEEIVAEGFDPEIVRRVARMVDRAEYKRRQAPPGVRITRRAFGRDRRYPITSGYREDLA
ncbi:NAD+ synthase [Inmirania thermothiophila]|uniref:Glutamine-dependent NAD(+) synthetase n=1 Tax=Inmirania thermothiophila TaxID=1750597 RepID=A0A3N1Y857_9GAMM|nr:NAD+ synthase [Inmirania thermothiophila]ROR34701.1 NAD+ synthase (glutamine-hydrolysing) [Inmirania thermothiophila]